MKAKNLAELYGLAPLEWDPIDRVLATALTQAPESGGPDRHTCWLATIDADGAPHVTGIGALWVDGAFWFVTGRTTRKGRNLARDPRCTMSVSASTFDLVVDGAAALVSDPAIIADLAARWREGGWPAEVDESGSALTAPYSAPSAGPPPWHVYRMAPLQATALLAADPGGATRFTFD